MSSKGFPIPNKTPSEAIAADWTLENGIATALRSEICRQSASAVQYSAAQRRREREGREREREEEE